MHDLTLTIKLEASSLTAAIEKLAAALLDEKALAGIFAAHRAKNSPDQPASVSVPVAPPANQSTAAAPATVLTPPTAPVTVSAPIAPTAPVAASMGPAPTAASTVSVAPVPTAPTVSVAPAPTAPTTPAPGYSAEQLGRVGADLVARDPGKMQALLALLQQFGAQAITMLPPEQYGAFATALRGLGADI